MRPQVLVFVLCVVSCIAGHVAILHSVVRKRAQGADPAVPRPKLLAEIIWAVIPALVLALLLTATWARVRANETPMPGVLMKVAR